MKLKLRNWKSNFSISNFQISTIAMFQNYLKIALRNLWRNKSTSFINIAGLSVGMTVALLIGLWLRDELTFDRFHEKHGQLYQVMLNDKIGGGGINTFAAAPLPLAEILRKSIPEIKYVAEQDWGWEHGLMVGERRFLKKGLQVHGDFLKMFSFPLLHGDPNSALAETHSIVLTERMAEALFSDADPMGKTVRIDNREDLVVTGVMKNPPHNNSFEFEYLVPFSYFEFSAPWVKYARSNWESFAFQLYVELQPGASEEAVNAKIRNLIKENLPDESGIELSLHPLDKWRLYSEFENGKAVGGFITYVRLFGVTGAFVLLIACINFMNLSTARSERRAKEVGVRKVAGSQRLQLISQFLSESVMVALLSFAIAIALAELVMPSFNLLTEKAISIPFNHAGFWALSLTFVLFTGLLAGSYPAFYLSSFQPVSILKPAGSFSGARGGGGGTLSRKVLVVSQFTLSVGLIICTLVVFQQIQFTKKRPAGYDPDRLVMVNTSPDLSRNYNALKNDLLASGKVTDVTKSGSPITAVFQHFPDVEWQGKQPGDKVVFANIAIADDYFKTTGIRLKEGRIFYPNNMADTASVIFNEAAVRRMGLEEPIGQTVRIFGAPRTIVGVTEDVVMTSPFEPVAPTMYQLNYDWGEAIMFRLAPLVNTHEALGTLERIFQKHNPAYPFIYQFANEQYAKKFGREELIGKLAGLFGGLAIFISCLGLFGLAAYMAERRTKEIGIRKVLGATTTHLWAMLSKEFVVLVLVSCLIASPLAAYFLNNWLTGYEYRTELHWWVFALAGGGAVVVTVLTVSFQSIKAALANPVKSLRSE
jgi:putative ABC transport system permease protein